MVGGLYFDDDSEGARVCDALADEGRVILRSTRVGMRGASDEEHLAFATRHSVAIVTSNRGDFQRIHTEYLTAGRHHAGIVIVLQQRYSVGEQVRRFRRLLDSLGTEDMADRIEWLSRWGDDSDET